MQDASENPFYDFMYPKFLLKDMFDIILHEDDYIEKGYAIFRDIGNIARCTHAIEFTIDESCCVKLPCNTEFIESVSSGVDWIDVEDGGSTIMYHTDWAINPNKFLPDVIINPTGLVTEYASQKHRLHPGGNYITYELHGTPGHYHLQFLSNQIGLTGICIYRGIIVDKEGNPLLTRKEAEAIAYKIAFLTLQKRIFMGDLVAAQIMQATNLNFEYGRKMQAAKIPEYISQNHFNRMLSAMTRHDRKVFWADYKTI
jgi:hypothetical protein